VTGISNEMDGSEDYLFNGYNGLTDEEYDISDYIEEDQESDSSNDED